MPFEMLRDLYINKTSDIVYIVKNKKLYGIICMNEVLRDIYKCVGEGQIEINQNFTVLTECNVVKAHELFQRNPLITKIPIVNDGELVGDYSRWDDMLYIERNHLRLMQYENVKKVLESYEAVYVAEPVNSNSAVYLGLLQYLSAFQASYTVLGKEQIGDVLQENAICIFLDEDERRGGQCLYGLKPRKYDCQQDNTFRYDMLADSKYKARLTTYKNLLLQIEERFLLEKLEINKPSSLAFDMINDKGTILLNELQRSGVKCFCLMYGNESRLGYTEYWDNFEMELEKNLIDNPISLRNPWFRKENEEFYGDLYQEEDYRTGIAQKEIFESFLCFEYKKDVIGKYFNAKDGRRVTCFQPQKYIGTIYMMGVCLFVGRHVEDQYTVCSYLQKRLLEKGWPYRVENYAAILRCDGTIDTRLEEIGEFHKNDIVVFQSNMGEVLGIEGVSLREIFEKHQISSKWAMDEYGHCNHKALDLIAGSLLEMIEPCLVKEEERERTNESIIPDFHDVMADYVKRKYLDRYFSEFNGWNYDSVGAIVMNCNPFGKGHHDLIERARKQVDFLIIFVIQEDAFLFSFEERYKMAADGTKDFDNVMVVPNGDFVFSKNNFREYYVKREIEAAIANAEYDISFFVEYIAKPLHITHRFAGEEHKNKVMAAYNQVMKNILPQKGIRFLEMPKLEISDEEICTSKIRKYLRNADYAKAFTLVPETTKRFIVQQVNESI